MPGLSTFANNHSVTKLNEIRWKILESNYNAIWESPTERIMDLKYDGVHSGHGIARDIFMVGVWTAQRVSGYNNLSKEICKDAGIDEMVEIEVTNGGTPKKVW